MLSLILLVAECVHLQFTPRRPTFSPLLDDSRVLTNPGSNVASHSFAVKPQMVFEPLHVHPVEVVHLQAGWTRALPISAQILCAIFCPRSMASCHVRRNTGTASVAHAHLPTLLVHSKCGCVRHILTANRTREQSSASKCHTGLRTAQQPRPAPRATHHFRDDGGSRAQMSCNARGRRVRQQGLHRRTPWLPHPCSPPGQGRTCSVGAAQRGKRSCQQPLLSRHPSGSGMSQEHGCGRRRQHRSTPKLANLRPEWESDAGGPDCVVMQAGTELAYSQSLPTTCPRQGKRTREQCAHLPAQSQEMREYFRAVRAPGRPKLHNHLCSRMNHDDACCNRKSILRMLLG